MNKLDLIQKVKAIAGLSNEERSTLIDLINTKKNYGLVWEDKIEEVEEELRQNLPVLKEVTERRILGSTVSVNILAENAELFTPENINKSESTYTPNHVLIEGDNLHALTALSFTHENKIDLIYIDPPYNTGNKDFKYNDRFVDKEDGYRHSKWLSFMYKRLVIAKKLLSDKGVIFISIDENESHNLRVMLDEVFIESNFIEQIVWNKRIPKNDKGIGNVHEYVLLYAKDYNNEHVFTQKKEGIEDVNEFAESLKKRKIPIPEAENEIKKFYKKTGYDRGITLYNSFNEEYRLWGKINVSWPNAKTLGPRYDVLHPVTKKPCKVPDRGWRWTRDTFDSLLDYNDVKKLHDGSYMCGRIWFAKDENTQPSSIKFLDEVNDFLLRSIISTKSDGGNELIDILGAGKFDYPKPVDLIHRLIGSTSTKDISILDFFAGSGTTLHATMQLNSEDGGTRQCILVTNNENNICEEVTYERNKRVIEGYKSFKGINVLGLPKNNLRFYKTQFVPSFKSETNKRLLTQASTDLLCIKENCYTDITESNSLNRKQCRIFTNDVGKYLVIVYHSRNQLQVCEQLAEFIKTLNNLTEKIRLYGFSPEKETLTEDFIEVANKIDAVPLPEAIYNAYRATFRAIKLDMKPPVSKEVIATETENEITLFNANQEEI